MNTPATSLRFRLASPRCVVGAALLCLALGRASAQQTPDAGAVVAAATVPVEETAVTQAQTPESEPQPQYVPALNGLGVIALNGIARLHVLVGGTVSGGYDTNPANISGATASSLYAVSPYVSVIAGSGRSQFVLQYHPTFTQYSAYSNQSMHEASADFLGNITPRLSWRADLTGAHGDNSTRSLDSSHSVAIGGVSGAGPSAASYLPDAGVVTNLAGGFGVSYETSARSSIALKVDDAYNSYPSLKMSGSVTTVAVNYNRDLRPSLGFLAYQQTSQYYGDLHCTTFGAGAGIQWEPNERTVLSARGGPQLDTSSCNNQQGFAYEFSASSKVTGRAQLYAMADRQPVTGYLGPGLWQDDVSAGYQREFNTTNVIGIDAGRVQSSTLLNSKAYSGVFVETSYTRKLQRHLELSARYRHYQGDLGNSTFLRDMATASLTFTPDNRSLSR